MKEIPDDLLERAMDKEAAEPSQTLDQYNKLENRNTRFFPEVLVASFIFPILATILAFYLTQNVQEHRTLATLFILISGYLPASILIAYRVKGNYDPGWPIAVFLPLYVIFGDLWQIAAVLVFTFITMLVITLPLDILLFVINHFTYVDFSTDSLWVLSVPAFFFWLACALANITPQDFMFKPFVEELEEIPVGLKVWWQDVLQFIGGLLLGALLVGGGPLGLLYDHLWEAVLVSGIAGLALGLTFIKPPRNYVESDLIRLGQGRCLIRLGRNAEARYLLKRVGDAPEYMTFEQFGSLAQALLYAASQIDRPNLEKLASEELAYAREPRYVGGKTSERRFAHLYNRNVSLTQILLNDIVSRPTSPGIQRGKTNLSLWIFIGVFAMVSILTMTITGGNLASPIDLVELGDSIAPEGTYRVILYALYQNGTYNIYTKNVVNNLSMQLTWQGSNRQPTWSPNGKKIAFVSNRSGKNEIFVMDSSGAKQIRLTPELFFSDSPAWSPDGKKIAFSSKPDGWSSTQIFVMDADGTNKNSLTSLANYFNKYPTWSPDGRQIAFFSGSRYMSDMYVMNADGSHQAPIHTLGSMSLDTPGYMPHFVWSPDGEWIVFETDSANLIDTFRVDAEGSNPIHLIEIQVFRAYPIWSPDGRKIAFLYKKDLYTMSVDGSDWTRLTNLGTCDGKPDWSPDGKKIAFGTSEEGGNLIYMINPDGSELVRITDSSGSFFSPAWEPAKKR